ELHQPERLPDRMPRIRPLAVQHCRLDAGHEWQIERVVRADAREDSAAAIDVVQLVDQQNGGSLALDHLHRQSPRELALHAGATDPRVLLESALERPRLEA